MNPATGRISRQGEVVRLEARTMRLLICLAQRAGEVVSADDLLTEVWSGVVVTQDSVYQAVASLRRLLGDDAKQPAYIATVPRLGYRMVASVSPWVEEPMVVDERPAHGGPPADAHAATPSASAADVPQAVALAAASPASSANTPSPTRRRTFTLAAVAAALCLALLAVYPRATAPSKSVAVLPFLDLTTQAMDEEYFADGMTEELIDRLSKVPGLRVPGATSSFYFKGKHLKIADIAKSLGVTYVLDGSIRKSESTLRVAARLIRADDGYVAWSETYDRPLDNKLKVQDDIATEVTKALQTSIN